MKRFTYKAKDKNGKLVVGEVEASTINVAAKLVRDKGLVVITIFPARESLLTIIEKFRNRITGRDVSTFTRQMATMINAGLPITDSLVILRTQTRGGMQKVVSQILNDVEGGQSLSAALIKHPKVFTPTYIALTKSGELGGVIDQVFNRLAENLEKEQEFAGKVKGALIYPTIIVVGMVVVATVMMIFVIPKLMTLYTEFNANLPVATKILITISNITVKFWPLVLVVGAIGFFAFTQYRKTPAGRRKTDELYFKLPIIGPMQKEVMLTELTRTMSLMTGAGVSILESLTITSGVTDNVIISDALKDAAKQVEKGFPIAYSFSKHPEAFPFILSQMIAVGEETGKMEEVLSKVSHVFEIESEERVKTLTSAIEPIVMIMLGLGVGFLVIAIILPIYNLTSSF
jgi:type IV pilus assembly protein PilC